MPAIRTHVSTGPSPRECNKPPNCRNLLDRTTKTPNEADVIVLSSDDEVLPTATTRHLNKSSGHPRKKRAALRPLPVVLGDVLEISDSDDAQSSSRPPAWKAKESSVENLKRTVASLEQALKVANQRAAEEVSELKSLEKAQAEEIAFLRGAVKKNDFSELEDHILCEVCTHRMWKPYVLPGCGHCFCQDCLVDWFSTTQAHFMANHPDYEPRRAFAYNQLRELLSSIPVLLNPRIQHQIQALLADLWKLQPEYTCPSCRKSVVTAPVEDFRLKALVRHISGLQGESSPHKERGHGHGITNLRPFDTFFYGRR
ncbi:hypothetical protein V8B97DRAFT_2020852 [Scleroderma yunnanense]